MTQQARDGGAGRNPCRSNLRYQAHSACESPARGGACSSRHLAPSRRDVESVREPGRRAWIFFAENRRPAPAGPRLTYNSPRRSSQTLTDRNRSEGGEGVVGEGEGRVEKKWWGNPLSIITTRFRFAKQARRSSRRNLRLRWNSFQRSALH